jgi:UDP-glucose 4-epimerase
MTVAAWIVGGTGQLGSALLRTIATQPGVVIQHRQIRWADPQESLQDLADGLAAWVSTPGATSLRLYWAAGSAVTSTTSTATGREVAVFTAFVAILRTALADLPTAIRVSVFFTSSAGGVYSGSNEAPPYSEVSKTVAISPYGEAKLAMEQAVSVLAQETHCRVLIGRVSTLYSSGQRINKAQGFVSQLCLSYILRRPISVYVPLDTIRDYIHADDAAMVIEAAMVRLERSGTDGSKAVVKNIASHSPTTLGEVIHQSRLIFKRAPTLILATSALAAAQIRDLRIGTEQWPDLNDIPRRQLVVGMSETKQSLERQMRAGHL